MPNTNQHTYLALFRSTRSLVRSFVAWADIINNNSILVVFVIVVVFIIVIVGGCVCFALGC